MSQIRKALEKAKVLRLDHETREPRERREGGLSRGAVVGYTGTRIIEVSQKELLGNKIVALHDKNPAADQFKFLRTRVFKHTRHRGWNVIQVTGFGPGEGKSLVAANLAVSIAQDPRQTALLADLDFRRPSVARLFGLGAKTAGLKSYIENERELEEIFVNPSIPKLTILPAGGGLQRAAEALGSARMEALLRELKHRYQDRYVILDTPGINVCPDPVIISEYADAIILVARAGVTSKANVTAAMERIPKEKILCAVLGDVRRGQLASYGYYAGERYSEDSNR
ncbi:MAG: hypothetical protein P4L55_01010 [Syntrophobacteraceae bacterium]|nr:hypothetical protein [Syntrophobacteraceae bacterium]